MSHDEDPLDLFDDDGDGVIETILLLDEEEEKQVEARTGCGMLLFGIVSTLAGAVWGISEIIA